MAGSAWTFTSPISSPSACSSLLEGLLSADNALVLAILVLGLPAPPAAQGAPLRHGRRLRVPDPRHAAGRPPDAVRLGEAHRRRPICCTWSYSHFFGGGSGGRATAPSSPRRRWLGLSRVLGDGREGGADRPGLLGRFDPGRGRDVAEDLGGDHRRHPRHHHDADGDRPAAARSSGAIRRSWTARSSSSRGSAVKLLIEYLNAIGYLALHVNRWFSFGLILAIFGAGYLYARRQGPVEDDEDDPSQMLGE